ncbi:ECF RNA polymerase sigma factor SigK [Amycolatopsis saalfeldensis]|uniref:RNA polymerase, sigma subunit, ECF family n=1 Tax=Amycolatopsis saalfeldensis TaxID=394193 RepID=A0A1H8YM84_9PSEU|nr:ECF RNA polymerase sigma factor SigK [Amycolatopsis saalfeldensis]SEP53162.1 RNA polymerase, sigma subunit, ECF family [Amycolatopsis saalfeldensis]
MATPARALVLAPPPAPADPLVTAEVLIGRVALGDEDAFAALYDQLAGPVLGMVTRVVRDRAQSEEVAQEVLLEVWRKAASFAEHRGSVRAWVLTIAHHRAIDRVRAEQAGSDRETRAGLLDPRRDFDEVAESTLVGLERDDVRSALAVLTDLQRESITLAYYDGYTCREVAERLGVSVSTIKSRMRDGLIRLRTAMGAQS